MRFLVLGPLRIHGSRELRPSAAKQRALLAILLVEANRVVSMARLVDELWESPPATAPNLIRQYVSQLRKLLDDGGAGPGLHTHAAGYRLATGPAGDSEDFERLVGATRDQLAAGRPEEARETAGGALALWRGPAFADVPDGPTVAAERARLEELRICAQELRAEAGLGTGRLAETIGELKALIVSHPLREQLRAALMVALAESGRKADALAAYRATRELLADELGLDPSPELRRLEQAILADEIRAPVTTRWGSEARPAATPARRPADRPVAPQPPPELPDFVGREAQLATLRRLLSGPSPVLLASPVVVSGLAGVGKTALAVRLAHSLRRCYPDGQLFLQLGDGGGPADPFELLGDAIELLGGDARGLGPGARRDRYRALLADRQVLVVLDGAVAERQVRPLLTGGRSAVLVTSRSPLAGLDGARHVSLPVFSPAEAGRLIELVVGADRVGAEPQAARAIGEACGGLPIAVRAAAARVGSLPHRGLRHVADQLDRDRVFDELAVGDLRVRDSVAATYRALDADGRSLLGRLAAAARPCTALTEQELGAPGSVVDRLVEAGVLEVAGPDGDGRPRFRCAELVRRYAGASLAGPLPA